MSLSRPIPAFAIAAGLVLLAICGLLVGGVYAEAHRAAQDLTTYPPPGRLIDVGGRRIHLNCTGKGNPVVVLEAGLSGWSQDWSAVQPALSHDTTVCSYDRAGYGWSDEGPGPRSIAALADDLSHTLDRAGLPRDRILVGHSMGGLIVQAYAIAHPEEVKGLVFVDSIQRDQATFMTRAGGTAYHWKMATLGDLGVVIAPIGLTRLVGFPASIIGERLPANQRVSARAMGVQAKAFRTLRSEYDALDESLNRIRTQGPLPEVPTVVLSTLALRDFPPGWDSPAMRELWKNGQERLGRETGATPIFVEGGGHYIHIEHPALVERAVRSVLVSARRKSSETHQAENSAWPLSADAAITP